jgi:Ni/Fe-hydrogenase subunit HybB-like protein
MQGPGTKVMTVFIILGVLLSCMHQSSLGHAHGHFAGPKLHPLWQTPILPMLFLLSALCVGFPMVILESLVAHRSLKLPPATGVLSRLAAYIPVLLGAYFAAKLIDLLNRGALGYLFEGSVASVMYLIEVTLGVLAPFLILVNPRGRTSPRRLMLAASLVIGGVVLNRLNVFLIGYSPTGGYGSYYPSLFEVAVTVGFVAMIVLLYRLAVFNFPIIEHFKEQEPCPRGF